MLQVHSSCEKCGYLSKIVIKKAEEIWWNMCSANAFARWQHTGSLLNSLEFRDNYSATSNNMKLVNWPLMGGLLHLVPQRGNWVGQQPTQSPLRVPNLTAHPSTSSVPITVLLLCSFSLPKFTKMDQVAIWCRAGLNQCHIVWHGDKSC